MAPDSQTRTHTEGGSNRKKSFFLCYNYYYYTTYYITKGRVCVSSLKRGMKSNKEREKGEGRGGCMRGNKNEAKLMRARTNKKLLVLLLLLLYMFVHKACCNSQVPVCFVNYWVNSDKKEWTKRAGETDLRTIEKNPVFFERVGIKEEKKSRAA